ncbi:hypothetical protein RIF29_19395 [Crotalaria pallida]|uniref:histone acetyltransferase n=1 Tax=Crotalaria pallida TaxID=3830 RepID=A0AAN9EZW7_CROPI
MHAARKGPDLGNPWSDIQPSRLIGRHSSSRVHIPLRNGCFDSSHQNATNQLWSSTDWRKHPRIACLRDTIRRKIFEILSSRARFGQVQKASNMATTLEYRLFMDAASEKEYMNQETLKPRLVTQLKKFHERKLSRQADIPIASTSNMVQSSGLLHAWPNGTAVEPSSQKLTGPIINATDYGSQAVNNNYGFPKGGLSHPYVDPKQPLSLRGGGSSINSFNDTNMFSNFGVSGAGRNLETSFKSSSSLLPQQHIDDLATTDVVKYRNCLGTVKRNESEAPLAAMENNWSESSKNCMLSYVPGYQRLNQPQLPTQQINDYEQFTTESSESLFGLDESACVNPGTGSTSEILYAYFQYKNLNSGSGDHKMSFIKYMHLTECGNEMCTCVQSMKLLLHTDNCESDNCHVCRPWKLYHANAILEPRLEFESSLMMDSIVRDNGNDAPSDKSEAIQPLDKRQKMDPAFSESLNNNASSGLWTQKIVHPYSSKEIPELQQQTEFPFSSFNVEGQRNPLLDSMDNSETKNNVIDDTLGQTFESETLPSQALEANHISDESVLKSHDGVASSNLKGNVIGLKSSIKTLCIDPIDAEIEDIHCTTEFNSTRENAETTDIELKADEEKKTKYSNTTVNHISEESDPKIHDLMASSNLEENVISLNCTMDTLFKDPTDADMEDIQGITELNHAGENVKEADIELKANQEKQTQSSTETVNAVALTEFFTLDQLREHISSLNPTKEEGESADSCQLCTEQKLFFAPVPIYCLRCRHRIKRNVFYYQRGEEKLDTQHFFCTSCYNNSGGGDITFNGTSVAKTLLDRKRNDDESEEAWVECDKCKIWQHQICALYNNKRDLDCSAVYICPRCRIKDIENGKHVPLPKTDNFGAKDLPRTQLSDHIENRLFKSLMKERADTAKVEGKNNPDEVLAAENLSVRVVLSVDKQLQVKKEFLDIFSDEDYPSEFLYRSKLILLFQNIEGVDICLFGMYVQEFGSECGLPNQRCVYISFLDSCKYFRPDRKTATGEALRTYVYHEILIGYLDYCKKRGFTTCYIYACPPSKGEDYIIYCKPKDQETPNKDKLRRWYQSMLIKASEENIVVGLTNMYDHFFVPTGKCDSKVTAARLPYFNGDSWCAEAMEQSQKIEQDSGGDYECQLKKEVSKRTLKAMGYPNPSKDNAKDILVMYKLGQIISRKKEYLIMVHLQHACMHCHEVIVSGKRWFCTECKNFQECERCHTADSHTSMKGEKHKLCQALIDDIPFDTKENDIILDNEFLDNRITFLSFCQNQKNKFQFDTPRRAKYSTMMIIDQLKSSTSMMTVGAKCSFCCKHVISQQSLQCEICPEFALCPASYKERGANCHEHKLTQASSTGLSRSGNQELNQNTVLMQQMLEVLQHLSQCCATKTQPCSYKNCLQMKKLFSHANRCTVQASGGCPHCKKAWMALKFHSKNCRQSKCCVPRCMDLKKHPEWIAMQAKSQCRAAFVESNKSD